MASAPGSPCQCFGFTLTFSSSENIVLLCCYEKYHRSNRKPANWLFKQTVELNLESILLKVLKRLKNCREKCAIFQMLNASYAIYYIITKCNNSD